MCAIALSLALLLTSQTFAAITIDTVPVGNTWGIADVSGYGEVAYDYRIGKTEVTNAQYVEFLNGVAKSDPQHLYNTSMATSLRAGILRSGSSPNFTYSLKPNFGDKPVNYVSFPDAVRFVNWLENGQPVGAQGPGTTEDGVYSLAGVANPSGEGVSRNPAAQWFLPSIDEWYKAAFYQPASQGGDIDDYWLYATATNTTPTAATANAAGDISNPGVNVVNGFSTANWNGSTSGNVTTVAGAGPLSQSFYGTFDQAGNVYELTDTIYQSSTSSVIRMDFGGYFGGGISAKGTTSGRLEDDLVGFRVARAAIPVPLAGDFNGDGIVDAADYVVWRDGLGVSYAPADYWVWRGQFGKTLGSGAVSTVPEPSSWLLFAAGGLAILAAWNMRRRHSIKPVARQTCLMLIGTIIAGWPLTQSATAATFNSQVIALRGNSAPDGNGTFTYFGVPTINDAGQIAFTAGLTATSGIASDNTGVFRGDSVTLTQIAREGQTTPDGNGKLANFVIGGPALNNAGQVAFAASLSGTTNGILDNGGIFRGDGISLTQMVREGQPAPDGNGTFSNLFNPLLNNAGQVLSYGVFVGTSATGETIGLVRADGSSLTQIARSDQAPPDGDGKLQGLGNPTFNDAGEVAFSALTYSNVNGYRGGIYRGDGGELTQIAREPRILEGGIKFTIFGDPALNSSGQVAFRGVVSNTTEGIYRGDGGPLTTLAVEGDTIIYGGKFSSFGDPRINDLGETAFSASLTQTIGGSNDNSAIFRTDGVTLAQIAREGQVPPGGNGIFSSFSQIEFNNARQLAFRSTLRDTIGGTSDNSGIFFFDDSSGLVKIVRTGDPLLGSTIASISFGRNMNELGQIAYYFLLADGRSGVAIATFEAGVGASGYVPEPSSLLLFLAALLALLVRRTKVISDSHPAR